MIRLAPAAGQVWLDLPYGVRFCVRPLDTPAEVTAWALAVPRFAQRLAGWVAPPAIDGADPVWRKALEQGVSKVVWAETLAETCLLAWEGVLAIDGRPAPLSVDTIAQVMAVGAIVDAFLDRMYAPLEAMRSEGESSGTVPAGITVPEPTTAPVVSAVTTTATPSAAMPANT